jgi:hypothetical protein
LAKHLNERIARLQAQGAIAGARGPLKSASANGAGFDTAEVADRRGRVDASSHQGIFLNAVSLFG